MKALLSALAEKKSCVMEELLAVGRVSNTAEFRLT